MLYMHARLQDEYGALNHLVTMCARTRHYQLNKFLWLLIENILEEIRYVTTLFLSNNQILRRLIMGGAKQIFIKEKKS